MDAVSRKYFAAALDVNELIGALEYWFAGQGMETKPLEIEGDEAIGVQARSKSMFRKASGSASAVHVQVKYEDPKLVVTSTVGSWTDKAVAGGVGMVAVAATMPLIGLPLLAASLVGAVTQSLLPQKCLEFIETWLSAQEEPDHRERPASPVSSARDFAADYEVISESSRQSPVDEDDLYLSDFDVAESAVPVTGEAEHPSDDSTAESLGSWAQCPICGVKVEPGAVVCSNGHPNR